MKTTAIASLLAAASLASSALAIDVVYDNLLEAEANWSYEAGQLNTVDGDIIGDFGYIAGPAITSPTFSLSEAYRWTVEASLDLEYSIETATANQGFGSGNSAAFSFISSVQDIVSAIGFAPADLIALGTTGLSGVVTLEEIAASVSGINASFASLFTVPSEFSVDPSSIAFDGFFGLESGSGLITLDSEIPNILATNGTADLSISVIAERLDGPPVSNVSDSGTSGVLALAGLGALVFIRRRKNAAA